MHLSCMGNCMAYKTWPVISLAVEKPVRSGNGATGSNYCYAIINFNCMCSLG